METVFQGKPDDSVQAIHRFSNTATYKFVNWYVIETAEGLTVVDAGFAGHWKQLVRWIASTKWTVRDIKAILLTHAHADHMGFAEEARVASGAEIWIHLADEQLAYSPGNPPKALLQNAWRPAVFSVILPCALFEGMMKKNPPTDARTFNDNAVLSVPGAPLVVHTPGHTQGHCAFYLPSIGVLFSGDEFCTLDVFRRRATPPDVLIAGLNEDHEACLDSLSRLQSLGNVLMLPGHGEPWSGDLDAAVSAARARQLP